MVYSVLTRLSDSLLRVGLNGDGLVALGIDEGVVHNLDAGVLGGQQRNLIGNGLGISEGRDILADVGEAHDNLVGVGSGQLSLGLLTKDNDIGVGVVREKSASSLAQTRVDTTAETLVGAGNDEQSLLVLEGLGLGTLEDLVRGLSVGSRVLHSSLGTGETGRGDDLHGVGDLLDVLDGLQTALDFTEGSEVGRIRGSSATRISTQFVPIVKYPLEQRAPQRQCYGYASAAARMVGCGPETYRVTAALPALTAGRTARENIIEGGIKSKISTDRKEKWRGEPRRFNWGSRKRPQLKRRG